MFKPITMLMLAVLPALPPTAQAHDMAQRLAQGKAVYQAVCMACHAPENVMVSSPKAGDVQAWARRAAPDAAGLKQLTDHAIDGLGAMPPKGGRPELTRDQIRDAIEFMRQPSTKG
ncbi:hypothetical protein GCM10027277_29400 [Pseudoduganella ginsengisoli]|uniref:C-type cytochrome n=1 Tax=Pseudoduganella ginsengisoli TaxID=1462440 RepID=A0A6L6Q120_9BURK|nr:c-type cytochrome [Pseudoduganella ginsengisoli]MTW03041.1 c-type cytochrome [Pseudoduganella ginsengisoli]